MEHRMPALRLPFYLFEIRSIVLFTVYTYKCVCEHILCTSLHFELVRITLDYTIIEKPFIAFNPHKCPWWDVCGQIIERLLSPTIHSFTHWTKKSFASISLLTQIIWINSMCHIQSALHPTRSHAETKWMPIHFIIDFSEAFCANIHPAGWLAAWTKRRWMNKREVYIDMSPYSNVNVSFISFMKINGPTTNPTKWDHSLELF